MHCDYLSVTVPESSAEDVNSELLTVVTAVGGIASYGGVHRLATGGTFKSTCSRGRQLYSVSGDFLAALRGHGVFGSYLSALACVPHNVSRLDVAHDVFSDSPRVLQALKRKVKSSDGVRLSRKKLNPTRQMKMITSPGQDGRDTGSLYLGNRTAEVRAKVYDKKHERFCNASQVIPATTRFELTVTGKAGASLRDAHEPDAVFWHFMSEVLSAPQDAPLWEKGGLGYSLPDNVSLLPAEALRRLLDNSPQLEQMFLLSDKIGANGYKYFLRILNDRYKSHINQQSSVGKSAVRAQSDAEA